MVVLASRMESKKKSLDAVDLNILPISQKPNDGRVVPLGSKRNLDLRNNEYYEFEIKTNDTTAEQNDQVIENVICHICDINVPKMYFNEHKNSFRHKFNANIPDIALRRPQLFMNKDDVKESNEKIPSKHYCSECLLVIDSGDKISHEQSIVHRNSIFLERLLNDFLKFNTNDEHEINNPKEDRKKIEVADTSDTKQDSKISKKYLEELNFDSVTKIRSRFEYCGFCDQIFLTEKRSLHLNSDLHSKILLKKFDSSSILFKALQVKNFREELNFDSVTKIRSRFEYCGFCDQIFLTEKRSLHLNSDLHSKILLKKFDSSSILFKALQVKNFREELNFDSETKIRSRFEYCGFCDQIFLTEKRSLHLNSDLHSKILLKKFDSSSILFKALQVKNFREELNFDSVTKIRSRFEYCGFCDQIFLTEKRSLHLNSDLHSKILLKKFDSSSILFKALRTLRTYETLRTCEKN